MEKSNFFILVRPYIMDMTRSAAEIAKALALVDDDVDLVAGRLKRLVDKNSVRPVKSPGRGRDRIFVGDEIIVAGVSLLAMEALANNSLLEMAENYSGWARSVLTPTKTAFHEILEQVKQKPADEIPEVWQRAIEYEAANPPTIQDWQKNPQGEALKKYMTGKDPRPLSIIVDLAPIEDGGGGAEVVYTESLPAHTLSKWDAFAVISLKRLRRLGATE